MKHFLILPLFLLCLPLFAQQPKPELFVLAVGVETYKDARFNNLNFCADDARDVAAAFKKQSTLYDVMEVKVLTDAQATRASIREELDRFAQLVTGDDLFVFFFSGHGFEDALLPYDFNVKDRFATSITKEDFKDKLAVLGCNYMVFLDACFSGSFAKDIQSKTLPENNGGPSVETALKQLAEALADTDKNAMIFTSSSSDQKSWECLECGHGYFAQTLMDCIQGKSYRDDRLNRTIRPESDAGGILHSLAFEKYMSEVVRLRTANQGTPQKVRVLRSSGGDFPVLAIAKNSAIAENPAAADPAQQVNTDADYDGFPDVQDECPNEYGTLKGCPDSDADGIPDHRDACPFEKGTAAEQGCPLRDTDKDGIMDSADKCPDKNGPKEWQGCPDSDKDGVPDHKDDCPYKHGHIGNNGCPPNMDSKTYFDKIVGNFILVHGGTFEMGSVTGSFDERPTMIVSINDFYIGETEVTQAQWKAVMGTNPSSNVGCDLCPVENVSWNDVELFLQKLNTMSGGIHYRLPSEAEWEFAARGGHRSRRAIYSGHSSLDNVGWYSANSNGTTNPVKTLTPNELGIYDMSGNVWEWCRNCFSFYSVEGQNQNESDNCQRIRRGGSIKSQPSRCTVSARESSEPNQQFAVIGFRLAMDKY